MMAIKLFFPDKNDKVYINEVEKFFLKTLFRITIITKASTALEIVALRLPLKRCFSLKRQKLHL